MNERFTCSQITFSTADIEKGLFVGEFGPSGQILHVEAPAEPLLPGVYRVIDGELFQIIEGQPEESDNSIEVGKNEVPAH